MTDARYTYTAGIPASRVGWLVARARAAAGSTDHDLAAAAGVPVRVVRKWERGDAVPTDDEMEAVALACGIRLTELLPRREAVSFDRATGIMRMGDDAVALGSGASDNDAVLSTYVGLVRRQRRLRPGADVRLRQEDLDALAEALDLDDDELEDSLVRLIGMSRSQAAALRAQLLRRRLAVPVVGMLAGLGLLSFDRLLTHPSDLVKAIEDTVTTVHKPSRSSDSTTSTAGRARKSQAPTGLVPGVKPTVSKVTVPSPTIGASTAAAAAAAAPTGVGGASATPVITVRKTANRVVTITTGTSDTGAPPSVVTYGPPATHRTSSGTTKTTDGPAPTSQPATPPTPRPTTSRPTTNPTPPPPTDTTTTTTTLPPTDPGTTPPIGGGSVLDTTTTTTSAPPNSSTTVDTTPVGNPGALGGDPGTG